MTVDTYHSSNWMMMRTLVLPKHNILIVVVVFVMIYDILFFIHLLSDLVMI